MSDISACRATCIVLTIIDRFLLALFLPEKSACIHICRTFIAGWSSSIPYKFTASCGVCVYVDMYNCVHIRFAKAARMITRMATSKWSSARETLPKSEQKKKEYFQIILRAAGMQGCLLGCSKAFRSMWNLLMWYMFFLHISYYRDAERMESTVTSRPGIHRRFVSPKISIFERELRKCIRGYIFCILHFELGAIKLFLHEKSLANAHSNSHYIQRRFLCICIYMYYI